MHHSRYSATVLPVDEGLTAEIVAAEADLRGPSPDAWFDRLDGDSKSLEAALGSALEHDQEQALRLAGAVWPYWLARGKVEAGRAWLGRLLDASEWGERTEARAKALYGAGTLAFSQGDREPSLRFQTESLAIAREHRNLQLEADALIGLAQVSQAGDGQRIATALHHVEEAERLEGGGGPDQQSAVQEALDVPESQPPA